MNEQSTAGALARPTERILVVEDNSDVLGALCELLTMLDWPYHATQSGEAALKAFQTAGNFTILLCDISLPGMSGIELAKKVHSITSQLQIIFMSGYTDLPAGALNFPFLSLPKPYTLSQLDHVLEKARSS